MEELTAAGPAGSAGMAAGTGDRGSGVAVPVELRRERRLVCVEYPGIVRDVSKMLPTLGGEEGVSRVRIGQSPRPRGRDGVAGLRPERRDHRGMGSDVWFPWQRSLRRALGRTVGGALLWETAGNGPCVPGSRGKRTVGGTRERSG